MMRRAIDMVVAICALALTAPLMALAALAIRLETPGAVIYHHRRVGRAGAEFDVLKLRTMVAGA
jgi:lipopolysaccharide/colanic/teichoic acid biosynthesis glycosyltransferase